MGETKREWGVLERVLTHGKKLFQAIIIKDQLLIIIHYVKYKKTHIHKNTHMHTDKHTIKIHAHTNFNIVPHQLVKKGSRSF